MSERMLITKLVRKGDRAELYAKGHQYKDLTLFTLSDLVDVGIDYEGLQEGVDTPCRFWAHYELSSKLNQHNNPYKDIVMLEPVDSPATTTSTDNSAIVAELRAIRALLEIVATDLADDPRKVANLQLGADDENADWIADPETRAEEQAIHDELEARAQAAGNGNGETLDEWFSGVTPTSPRELLQVLAGQDCVYNSPRTLHDALAEQFGDTWKGWPPAGDLDAWIQLTKTALQLMTVE